MSFNLMTSGVVNPQEFPLQQLLTEAAAILNISPNRILKIQRWNYQLWVNIQGVGGKFVSYRRLPMWLQAAKKAIFRCASHNQLHELASFLRAEIRHYHQYYSENNLEMLRGVWAERAQEIKAKEEQMQPIKAHQEAAQAWQQSWIQILRHCGNIYALKRLVEEIQAQSEEYLDIQGILEPIEQFWSKRWHELAGVG